MDLNSIYLISNGSSDYYPENKLTHFTNHLPVPIEFNEYEKWEVGVESFGISCNFKKSYLDVTTPHVLIGSCQQEEKKCDETCQGEKPIKFKLQDESCWHRFFLTRDAKEIIRPETFSRLAADIYSRTNIIMNLSNNQLSFDLNHSQKENKNSFWIAFSKEFSELYGLSGKFIRRQDFEATNLLTSEYDPYYFIDFVMINGKRFRQRQAKLGDVEYNVYFLGYHSSAGKFSSLSSDVFVLEKNYPKLVKIFCSEIEPQIFNNTFSKDLLIFSPDFQRTEDFFFKEVECLDFIPLINTTISDITIKLLDENNEQLRIERGHATIIKLRLRKMNRQKKSFNIRLSSEKTALFPNNSNYNFKVKLPNIIDLDDGYNWRVCVNSINHPAKFSTMLVEELDRMIIFKERGSLNVMKLIFDTNTIYNEEKIFGDIDVFLKSNGIGYMSNEADGKKCMYLTKPGTLVISKFVGYMLGFSTDYSKHLTFKSSKVDSDLRSWDASKQAPKLIKQIKDADLSLLKPNYIMVYSDIVKSTIIGGNFSKILKIIPLKSTDLNYIIQEFRTKELIELESTQLDVIEINLRSHDGAFINFLSNQDVILNLELSNYYD